MALLLLPLATLSPVDLATAEAETERGLRAKIVTGNDFKRALAEHRPSSEYNDVVEIPSIDDDDLVSAGRRWEAPNGSFIEIHLIAYRNDSRLTSDDRKAATDGSMADDFVSERFENAKFIKDLGEVIDADDFSRAYEVEHDGKKHQAVVVTFARANLAGILVQSTPPVNGGFEAGFLFGMQSRKLE
jgi:hypothetical protein